MPKVLWRALLDSTFTGRGRVGGVRNVRLTYMEPHTKPEFDSAIGVTFNAKNPATDYKNGDDFIWDWAIGKNFATCRASSQEVPVNGRAAHGRVFFF